MAVRFLLLWRARQRVAFLIKADPGVSRLLGAVRVCFGLAVGIYGILAQGAPHTRRVVIHASQDCVD